MSQVLIILIGISLHLVPADVTTFSIQTEKGEVSLTRQADDHWQINETPVTFNVTHATLVIESDGEKQEVEFSEIAGVGKDTDWAKLRQIRLGSVSIQIKRKANGVDFIMKATQGDKYVPRTYKARWKRSPKKSNSNKSDEDRSGKKITLTAP